MRHAGCFKAVRGLLRAVRGNEALEVDALRHLLFDFHLWKAANSQVQITVSNFLVQFLEPIDPAR
jgi:hypothetical protein